MKIKLNKQETEGKFVAHKLVFVFKQVLVSTRFTAKNKWTVWYTNDIKYFFFKHFLKVIKSKIMKFGYHKYKFKHKCYMS